MKGFISSFSGEEDTKGLWCGFCIEDGCCVVGGLRIS